MSFCEVMGGEVMGGEVMGGEVMGGEGFTCDHLGNLVNHLIKLAQKKTGLKFNPVFYMFRKIFLESITFQQQHQKEDQQ